MKFEKILELDNVNKNYYIDDSNLDNALSGISFVLNKGECLGLIGANGSGKSTILKLIMGMIYPTSGKLIVPDNMHGLLELGSGLDPNQTGYENVAFYLKIVGFKKKNLERKIDEIKNFSELGHAFYNPINTYSSGMGVRLAYSMHALTPADVLIVDEALAVGDARFQHKCFNHIQKLRNDGVSIIFVSHSLDQIRQLCDRVIVLDKGHLLHDGGVEKACNLYMQLMLSGVDDNLELGFKSGNDQDDTAADDIKSSIKEHPLYNKNAIRNVTQKPLIDSVEVYVNNNYITTSFLEGKSNYKITLHGKSYGNPNLLFGFCIKTVEGLHIIGSNNYIDQKLVKILDEFSVSIEFSLALKSGDYFLDIGVAEIDGSTGGKPLDVIYSCIYLPIHSVRKYQNDGFIHTPIEYKSLVVSSDEV